MRWMEMVGNERGALARMEARAARGPGRLGLECVAAMATGEAGRCNGAFFLSTTASVRSNSDGLVERNQLDWEAP